MVTFTAVPSFPGRLPASDVVREPGKLDKFGDQMDPGGIASLPQHHVSEKEKEEESGEISKILIFLPARNQKRLRERRGGKRKLS